MRSLVPRRRRRLRRCRACGSATGEPRRSPSTSLTIVFARSDGAKPVVRTLTATRRRHAPAAGAGVRRARGRSSDPFARDADGRRVHRALRRPADGDRDRARSTAGASRPTFTRTNGCEIDRWSRHAFLFPLGRRAPGRRSVRSVLFVGAGRHQRRAILRAKELGLRVVAVDRNPDALGLQEADVGEAVDFTDVDAVTEVGRSATGSTACSPCRPTARCRSSPRSPSRSACPGSARRRRTG